MHFWYLVIILATPLHSPYRFTNNLPYIVIGFPPHIEAMADSLEECDKMLAQAAQYYASGESGENIESLECLEHNKPSP